MRYILSVIFGVFVTLALSIPLHQLMRLKEAEAITLRARNAGLSSMGSKPASALIVDVPPLSTASSDRREPRIKFLPQYPSEAAARQIEGYVTLGFKIQPDGSVTDLRIIESKPPQVFDQAARRAVSRWNFGPALEDENRSEEQRLRLNFSLRRNMAGLETVDR